MLDTKILIVEDDSMLSAIFDMFLKEIGYKHIETVEDSNSAIYYCKTENPDIVLMDIHLEQGMSGIEIARTLGDEFNIPVIYITGDSSIETVKNAVLKNTYGFLTKPIHKATLEISIQFALNKHKLLNK